ncbi:MAG: PqqD family protein [Bacteroidales bacterium]|nr:PqqD family protein [Bacteroidales bacterium]
MHINKNIAISETGFVFNPLTGDSFSTNKVGQEILRKMQDEINEKELTEFVIKAFSVDRNTVEKDLNDFILMLKSYQILIEDEKA